MERQPAGRPVPWCVFDAGYDPEGLARALGDRDGERVAVLVRLRRGRCFYADPLPPTGPRTGRPRRHGAKFVCLEEQTWWPPTAEHQEMHAQYGRVRVRAWAGVHAKSQNHPDRGSRRTQPTIRGTLVLVAVERLPRQTRIPKRLWLWWRGPGAPDLAVLWRASVHRFDLEPTYRFCQQVLSSRLRSTHRRPRSLALGAPHESAEADEHVLDYEHVYRALEKVDALGARIVQLKHFEQLTFEQIAPRVGMPPSSAKTHYQRALARLRVILEPLRKEAGL